MIISGFPRGSADKESAFNARDTGNTGLIPGQEGLLDENMATHFSTLPEKSQGQKSMAGYSPRGHKESDTAERLSMPIYFKSPRHGS